MAEAAAKNKRRSAGDGGLYQDAKGLWVGIVWVTGPDGSRKQKRVASKDKAVASGKLNRLRADVLTGKVTAEPKASWTVAQWADHWLTDIAAPRVRPETYASYEGTVRLYIKPHIGGVRLDKLQPANVRAMQKALHKVGSTRNMRRFRRVSCPPAGKSVPSWALSSVSSAPALSR